MKVSEAPLDALLVVSFGGPEGMDDVVPFLENVTRGRAVPPARLAEVAGHYLAFGGVSPINAQNRALVAALERELEAKGPPLPVYWGNRNWHPLLVDTVTRMAEDGVRRAAAFVTSAFSSYSGCRQYREDIERARAAVGPGAPVVDKLRVFHDHPGFIEPMAARVAASLAAVPAHRRAGARLVFTAHSIPVAMAETCAYQAQLVGACRLVAGRQVGSPSWDLAFQSRSGPPHQPWLGPDVNDHLRALAAGGVTDVVLAPIGFVSDHMEVVHDLDGEARATAAELGLNLVRAATVGTDPAFVAMVRDLLLERMAAPVAPGVLAGQGRRGELCGPGCCPRPA